MTPALLIARRELGSYFKTMSGYVIVASVLALNGLFFNAFVLGSGKAQLSGEVISQFFYATCGFTMIAAVLLSMRLLAEERSQGTLPLLYSSPVTDRDIVLGKFLSGLAFLGLFLFTTLYMPLLVM